MGTPLRAAGGRSARFQRLETCSCECPPVFLWGGELEAEYRAALLSPLCLGPSLERYHLERPRPDVWVHGKSAAAGSGFTHPGLILPPFANSSSTLKFFLSRGTYTLTGALNNQKAPCGPKTGMLDGGVFGPVLGEQASVIHGSLRVMAEQSPAHKRPGNSSMMLVFGV